MFLVDCGLYLDVMLVACGAFVGCWEGFMILLLGYARGEPNVF